MALHYIHLSNGYTLLDAEGTDVPVSSARDVAVRTASELLNRGNTEQLWTGKPWKVWVTDQPNGAGHTIASIEITGTIAT
jgi:hypothetical protein